MKNVVRLTGLAILICLTGSLGQVAAHAASKDNSGAIVIVFKDGHRQSFNLSDIDRVEFAGGASRPLPRITTEFPAVAGSSANGSAATVAEITSTSH